MRSAAEAVEVLEEHLVQDSSTPRVVFEALHMLREKVRSSDVRCVPAMNDKKRCLKNGIGLSSRYLPSWNSSTVSDGDIRSEERGSVIRWSGANGKEKKRASVYAILMAKVLEEGWRREIESAIRNVRRSAEDKQWRRQWYRATGRVVKSWRGRYCRNRSQR